jgi:hypothetical protein
VTESTKRLTPTAASLLKGPAASLGTNLRCPERDALSQFRAFFVGEWNSLALILGG